MKLENLKYTDSGNFFLLAGPCVIEGEYMAMDIAEKIVGITESLQIPYISRALIARPTVLASIRLPG